MKRPYAKSGRADNVGSIGNKIWRVVIYLAVALPFVSLGYELARTNWLSALVFASILLAWATVMFVAWSQKPVSAIAPTTSQPVEGPGDPARKDVQVASEQQARHA